MGIKIGLLIICCMLMIGGCGSKSGQDSATITVWHWMTDKQPTFEELARRYEIETGTKVKFDLYAPSDAYTQKVRAASQANRLPDIYGILAEKHDLASFVKAGYLENLEAVLNANSGEWKNQIFGNALAHDAFTASNEYGVEPGIYGIPIDLMTIQMVYNKNLFSQAGLDPENPPRTWEEFIAAGNALRQAGIQCFVSGFAEVWMIDCLASNFAFNIMGEEKVIDTFRGNVPYTDPDWVKVLSLFQEMAEADLFMPGITNFTNKEAEQMFANGRAAIAFNGSWCVNVYREMNPDLNYGVFTPPAATQDFPVRVWGSAGAGLLVNAQSPRNAAAVQFLKWLTSSPQQSFYAKQTNNIPANKACLKDLSPILAQFAAAFDNSTHPSEWPIMETASIIETLNKGIQLIMIGVKTPQEIAREIQAAKEREMAARVS